MPGRINELDLNDPERFEPTPWEAFTYDENDNAGRTLDVPGAKHVPASHLNTPSSLLVDALGRAIQSVERNGPDPDRDWFTTASAYDIRGNVVSVMDALKRLAFRYSYDLENRALRTESIDAGTRRAIFDAAGNEVERRDAKGAVILQAYDDLNRPIRFWARDDDQAGSIVTLRQRLVYGDGGSANQPLKKREANRNHNRLGALHQHFDEAGRLTFESYDFKGNVLEKVRHVISDEAILAVFPLLGSPPPKDGIRAFRVDWARPDAEVQLDPQPYETSAEYDALSRVKLMRYPRDEEGERKDLRQTYNPAGALEQLRFDGKLFVDHIAYSAKGQRTLIALGNKTITIYAYEPHMFRLGRQMSGRFRKSGDYSYKVEALASAEDRKEHLFQDCAYEHDLVGNIVAMNDRAPDCGLSSDPHRLDRSFAYDALYHLRSATGRECDWPLHREPWNPAPRCSDLTRTRKYIESYDYDSVGNIVELRHGIDSNGFRRKFDYRGGTNRLASLTVGAEPGDSFRYTHDANGNLTEETTSRHFEWDHSDRLKAFRTEAADGNFSVHAHYLYAAGIRVKKLVRNQTGQVEVNVYIDGIFENHRRSYEVPANNTLQVMDDQTRLATVRVGKPLSDDSLPAVRFHIGDHLNNSKIIVDDHGFILNKEEYSPYGETSFGSFGRKRYRFSGKERDEESGLYYFEARQYMPWIARWATPDPLFPHSGESTYIFSGSNPLRYTDKHGLQATDQVDHKDTGTAVYGGYDEPDVEGWTDQSGKFHRYETIVIGPKTSDVDREPISEPGLLGSLIPIYGSGRAALHHFQKGNWFRGTLYFALAITDVFLIKSIATMGGKLLFKTVSKATEMEMARNVTKNAISTELVHLTTSAKKAAIDESGKLGGRWGLFAIDASKVPSSQVGRTAATLVPGALTAEVKISATAAMVFARPLRFGWFSAARYYAGVRASPLGSLILGTGEFSAGEIFKEGAFRLATRGEYALQLAHQWLLDYGIDALSYYLPKGMMLEER